MAVFDDYECDGQMTLFDMPTSYMDTTVDRDGKEYVPANWMKYERCENCPRWVLYPTDQQPQLGWGVFGWCQENKQKCSSMSYCQEWEDKRKVK